MSQKRLYDVLSTCSIQYVIISLIQDVRPFIESQTEDENDSRVEEEDDGEQEAGT